MLNSNIIAFCSVFVSLVGICLTQVVFLGHSHWLWHLLVAIVIVALLPHHLVPNNSRYMWMVASCGHSACSSNCHTWMVGHGGLAAVVVRQLAIHHAHTLIFDFIQSCQNSYSNQQGILMPFKLKLRIDVVLLLASLQCCH